jgi:hypothetical protein
MATFDPTLGSDAAQDDALRNRAAAKAKAAATRAAKAADTVERAASNKAERAVHAAKRAAIPITPAEQPKMLTQGAKETAGGFAQRAKSLFGYGSTPAVSANPVAARVGMTGAEQAAATAARGTAGKVTLRGAAGAAGSKALNLLSPLNPVGLAATGIAAGMQANTDAYNADPTVRAIEGTPKGQQFKPLTPAQAAQVESGKPLDIYNPNSPKAASMRTAAAAPAPATVPTTAVAPEANTPERQIAQANGIATTAVTPVKNTTGVYGFRDAAGVQNFTDGRSAGVVPTVSDADRAATETARLAQVSEQQRIDDKNALGWQIKGAQSDINLAGNAGALRAAKERFAGLMIRQEAAQKGEEIAATASTNMAKAGADFGKAQYEIAKDVYQRGRDAKSDARADNAAVDTATRASQDRLASLVGTQQNVTDDNGQVRTTNVANPTLAAEISAAYANRPGDIAGGMPKNLAELDDATVQKFAGAYQLSKTLQANKGKVGAEVTGTIPSAWQLMANPDLVNVDANGNLTVGGSIFKPAKSSLSNPLTFSENEISKGTGSALQKYVNQLKGQF